MPQETHELLITANSLRKNLEHELAQLRVGNRSRPELKQVYEAVCLPVASSLAGRLTACDLVDLEILPGPLAGDVQSASRQLRHLLQFLHMAIIAVADQCAPPM